MGLAMSIYGILQGRGPSGFGYSTTAEQVCRDLDLSGKRYLLTGSNSGIGLEMAKVLASRGATVLALARTRDKAEQVCAALATPGIAIECELSEPASVLTCVRTVQEMDLTLDGIIANAGIMALPGLQQKYDLELQFLTNHLGHFILVNGLLDRLSSSGRVVILSSSAHRMTPSGGIDFNNLSGNRGYKPWLAYGQSKLANLLFARSLGQRFQGSQRLACAVHPGVIRTNLGRHMHPLVRLFLSIAEPLFLKSIPEGASTMTWAAVHPGAADLQGEFLADCNLARSSSSGRDLALAERLWDVSVSLSERFT